MADASQEVEVFLLNLYEGCVLLRARSAVFIRFVARILSPQLWSIPRRRPRFFCSICMKAVCSSGLVLSYLYGLLFVYRRLSYGRCIAVISLFGTPMVVQKSGACDVHASAGFPTLAMSASASPSTHRPAAMRRRPPRRRHHVLGRRRLDNHGWSVELPGLALNLSSWPRGGLLHRD